MIETDKLITVIGRGHSGTRAMSHTLSASGVFMGAKLNKSGDLVPADDLYEACRVFGHYVECRGHLEWDFTATFEMPIDPAFTRLVESYLESVLASDDPAKGWKLPETTLILPWIIRLFPEAYYVYWVRDPRDSVMGRHLTDNLRDFGVACNVPSSEREARVQSWLYQYEIMRRTPPPVRCLHVRFEDFVMNQAATLCRLEAFLGMTVAEIEVRPDSVGRWKSDPEPESFAAFPPETLYHGQLKEASRR